MERTSNNSPLFRYQRPFWSCAIVALFVLVCGLALAPDRIWSNLLVVAFFLLTISLGGAVFVALTYVCGAGWHVAFRRVPEAMAKVLPIAGAVMLMVLGIRIHDYGWHHHGEGDVGAFWFKELWLTPSFWAIRAVVYILLWSFMAGRLVARSQQQDESGDAEITESNARYSAFFLIVYAITFSLASIDWIMALEPMWFSTMWGVYHFAGMFQAALAVVIILALVLRAHGGPLHGVFNDEHLHDLGKLLIGFSCFWMYIWFSQYMLIWYSNIPEETSYFISRAKGPWGPIVVATIVLNWIIPFFVLLRKRAKRSGRVMMKIAVVVLIGRWFDLYLMIFPASPFDKTASPFGTMPVFGVWEVAAIACLIGLAGALLSRSFATSNAVPSHDRFLPESLSYHADA